MFYWALLLHLSLLVILSHAEYLNGSCTGYTNLTDPWRNRSFRRPDIRGDPSDDRLLVDKWWRFTGIGGDRASEICQRNAGSFGYPWNVKIILSVVQTPAAPLLNVPVPLWEAVFVSLDIDECVRTADICGPDSICTNVNGTYNCTCLPGFNDTNPAEELGTSPSCEDIDECLEYPCGEGDCNNIPASFECNCHVGYRLVPTAAPPCQDIDECFNSTVCGPRTNCTNVPGKHICQCEPGYIATDPSMAPDEDNTCEDVDECVEDVTICGPEAVCNNTIGAHFCTCNHGYRLDLSDMIASSENPCNDIDECSETVDLCGTKTVCTNAPGTFDCSCPDGNYPSTGVFWEPGVTFCQSEQTDLLNIL
ncbi:unnamed protein product [Boreogadus saida]